MSWGKLLPIFYLIFGVAEIIGEVYQIKLTVYIFKPLLMPGLPLVSKKI